jgi:CP family cyanate transporter-like MFS transporter
VASVHARSHHRADPGESELKRLTAAGIVLLALNLRIAVGEIPPVLRDLPLSDFDRSLLVTIPVICFSLAAFAGPPLSARLGEERGLLIMCGALCAGLALRPWWPSASLFVGTVVCGIAVAVMNVMMPSVLRRRFPKRMGEMTAAYTMSLSIGAGLAAGLTVPLVRQMGGAVAPALAIWALPVAIAFVLWLPQLRLPRPGDRVAGADIGLLRDWQAWQITLFFGLQSALYYTLLSWLPTIYRDRGVSPTAAGAVLAVMSAVGILGNFATPLLAHRTGDARLVVVGTSALTAIGLLGVLLVPNQLSLLWATMLGIGTGGTFSLTLLLIGSRAHNAVIAVRLSSMAQGIGYMIAALGPFTAGLLHSAGGGWTLPIAFTLLILGGQLAAGVGAARPGEIAR